MSIKVENLSYTYSPKTPFEKVALDGLTFEINDGETVGIIGSTGSGKSTLVQHFNGLIKLTSGSLTVNGIDLSAKKPDYKRLRASVGMLFQYPEYQLFEESVLKDVAFGPQNFGHTKEEAYELAKEAIGLVGLDYEEVKDKSPFELSGGQKRRVAIAGVIASKPEILILDEPTAGLDPIGKREILTLVTSLKNEGIKTVVIISHNMDEIAEFCDRVLVLNDSKLICDSTPKTLFEDENNLRGTGLALPHAANIVKLLKARGINIDIASYSAEAVSEAILKCLGGNRNG